MESEISHIEELQHLLDSKPAVLVFFYSDDCSVCRAIKPRVRDLVEISFPRMEQVNIHAERSPELMSRNLVFAFPTIIVFFEGREYLRKAGTFGILEFRNELNRLYHLMFL